jgi:hypothetical protein
MMVSYVYQDLDLYGEKEWDMVSFLYSYGNLYPVLL